MNAKDLVDQWRERATDWRYPPATRAAFGECAEQLAKVLGVALPEHHWKQVSWEYDFAGFTCQRCYKHVQRNRGVPLPTEHGPCLAK